MVKIPLCHCQHPVGRTWSNAGQHNFPVIILNARECNKAFIYAFLCLNENVNVINVFYISYAGDITCICSCRRRCGCCGRGRARSTSDVSGTALHQLVAVGSSLVDDIVFHVVSAVRVWIAVDRVLQIVDVDTDARQRLHAVV